MSLFWWSWLLTIVGITGFLLAGRKVWWAWYINIGCQGLWFAYAIISHQYGFIAAALLYTVVFSQNAMKWTKEHKSSKEKKSEMAEENNLVNHAKRELALLGEDSEIIDGYLKMIQIFADMGHSGGSASVFIPVLYRLLSFKNLKPLTDDPAEWVHHTEEVWPEPGGVWQNVRDGEAFSDDGGKTYTILSEAAGDNSSKVVHTSLSHLTTEWWVEK